MLENKQNQKVIQILLRPIHFNPGDKINKRNYKITF